MTPWEPLARRASPRVAWKLWRGMGEGTMAESWAYGPRKAWRVGRVRALIAAATAAAALFTLGGPAFAHDQDQTQDQIKLQLQTQDQLRDDSCCG
jgi:hypothetical protein